MVYVDAMGDGTPFEKHYENTQNILLRPFGRQPLRHHMRLAGADESPLLHVKVTGSLGSACLCRAQQWAAVMGVLGPLSVEDPGLLMGNHVHLVAVPDAQDAMARTLARTHAEYARHVNIRARTSGHFWQAR